MKKKPIRKPRAPVVAKKISEPKERYYGDGGTISMEDPSTKYPSWPGQAFTDSTRAPQVPEVIEHWFELVVWGLFILVIVAAFAFGVAFYTAYVIGHPRGPQRMTSRTSGAFVTHANIILGSAPKLPIPTPAPMPAYHAGNTEANHRIPPRPVHKHRNVAQSPFTCKGGAPVGLDSCTEVSK